MNTRLGELPLQIPQVRGEVEFYPSALERGVRSERALKCAIAEMYVQGVSTRKVTEVMRELCGLEISSTQMSRATKLLDEELSRLAEPADRGSPVCLSRCALRKDPARGIGGLLRRADGLWGE